MMSYSIFPTGIKYENLYIACRILVFVHQFPRPSVTTPLGHGQQSISYMLMKLSFIEHQNIVFADNEKEIKDG